MSENNTTSVSLDEDVDHYRRTECNNFSGLVNDLVRAYIQNGEQINGIRKFRKQQLKGEIQALKSELEIKTGQLENLEDSPDPEAEEYRETLKDKAQLYPDPKSGAIKDMADKFDKEPETVAEDLADMFNKEVPTDNGLEY